MRDGCGWGRCGGKPLCRDRSASGLALVSTTCRHCCASTSIHAIYQPRTTYELLHLKAKIPAKQGDKEGATAAAKESKDLAIKAEGTSSSFVKMDEDLISSLP